MKIIRKHKSLFLVLAIIIVPFAMISNNTTEVKAWGWLTHQTLPVIATGYLENSNDLGEFGNRWADLFKIYESDLKLGGTYPDRVLKDSTNHVYHVLENTSMFRKTPEVVRFRYESFKAELLKANYSGAVFEAGIMSHYIVDLYQPMHTAGAATSPKEHDSFGPGGVDPHSKFEQDVNNRIKGLVFQNYTPMLLNKSLEQTIIDSAVYSNKYYLDLVETYWNGSFWTPWVQTMVDDVLNRAVKTLANIIFTAIKEVNITLPDFSPLKINIDLDFPISIALNKKYTGTITVTDGNKAPLDVDLSVSRTYISQVENSSSPDGYTENILGPFLLLFSRVSTGVYSFDLTLALTGTHLIEIVASKANMISNTRIHEFTVSEPDKPDNNTSIAPTVSTAESSGVTSPGFSVILTFLTVISLVILRKKMPA